MESDTDTMSCCDDSSPDHYQPIGSHLCEGVATTNPQGVVQHVRNSAGLAQCSTHSRDESQHTPNSGGVAQHSADVVGINHHTSTGGVAQHTAAHRGGVDSQQFHPDDDEELDKLFASVEVSHIL